MGPGKPGSHGILSFHFPGLKSHEIEVWSLKVMEKQFINNTFR